MSIYLAGPFIRAVVGELYGKRRDVAQLLRSWPWREFKSCIGAFGAASATFGHVGGYCGWGSFLNRHTLSSD
jgi:hypothetical protein